MRNKLLFSEQIANSTFSIEFIKVLSPIVSKHIKIYSEAKKESIDYENIGTEKEKKLKQIANYFGLLNNIFADLELVLIFLRIEDRKSILELYPNLATLESYFKYHFENYIIRVTSISDIIGKFGNLLYELKIDEKKCNGYTFKEKIKSEDIILSEIIEKLLLKTKAIKDKRHKKIHKGETEINYLDRIIFFDDFNKIVKLDSVPLLNELTGKNLNLEINKIEQDIQEIVGTIVELLNHSTSKFIEISNR